GVFDSEGGKNRSAESVGGIGRRSSCLSSGEKDRGRPGSGFDRRMEGHLRKGRAGPFHGRWPPPGGIFLRGASSCHRKGGEGLRGLADPPRFYKDRLRDGPEILGGFISAAEAKRGRPFLSSEGRRLVSLLA